jgi:hypothetical protein
VLDAVPLIQYSLAAIERDPNAFGLVLEDSARNRDDQTISLRINYVLPSFRNRHVEDGFVADGLHNLVIILSAISIILHLQ